MTREELKSVLIYNPEMGIFVWKPKPVVFATDKTWNARYANRVAGSLDESTGYWKIRKEGVSYRAHQLAFLWMTGAMPPSPVKHVNGRLADNRWNNLKMRGE